MLSISQNGVVFDPSYAKRFTYYDAHDVENCFKKLD